MAERKTSRKKFSPLFYSHLKALWETGRFASVDDFCKYGKETFKVFPSSKSIIRKIQDEKWNKHKLTEENEKRLNASYTDLFSDQGMGDVEVVKRICEGIRAPERTIAAIVTYASKNGGKIDPDTLKDLATALNYDLRTAEGYLDQRHKLVGAYAASKHKLSGKVSVTDIDQMSYEEAMAENDRINKNITEFKARSSIH